MTPLNQCAGCGADFTSLELFDRHRVGGHAPDQRRCLSVDEMIESGWQQDDRGRWRHPVRAERARRAFAVAA